MSLVLVKLVWYVFQPLLLHALLPLKIVDCYSACVLLHLMHNLYNIARLFLVLSLCHFNMLSFYLSWSCVATNGTYYHAHNQI